MRYALLFALIACGKPDYTELRKELQAEVTNSFQQAQPYVRSPTGMGIGCISETVLRSGYFAANVADKLGLGSLDDAMAVRQLYESSRRACSRL
jgi:hypothetical protein